MFRCYLDSFIYLEAMPVALDDIDPVFGVNGNSDRAPKIRLSLRRDVVWIIGEVRWELWHQVRYLADGRLVRVGLEKILRPLG